MEDIQTLSGITPRYDRGLIETRLGYNRRQTVLTEDQRAHFDGILREAEMLCRLDLAWRFVGICGNDGAEVALEDGTVLHGTGLSTLLRDSRSALVMFVTAGSRPLKQRDRWMRQERLADAVVLDAAVSEITDAGLDWLMQYVNNSLRRTHRMLTRLRYSPGYGDWALSEQQLLAGLLDIGRLGATLTDRFILTPEKSVLAVAGVSGSGAEQDPAAD